MALPLATDGRDPAPELEVIEIELLLEGLFKCYGYDFRQYAPASIRRRILAAVEAEGTESISALGARMLHDPECAERVLLKLTVHTTAMFRDPGFYRSWRGKALPWLKEQPFVRLWCAGCSSGEEVYSLAILLHEEGLYERCRIYATDLSPAVTRQAKAGIYPLAAMQEYTKNYIESGGKHEFSAYYTADGENAVLRDRLRRHIVFAEHNLTTDASFNEFHAVLCRNVMIYFQKPLQDRVHRLVHGSLAHSGFLALGRNESMKFTPHEGDYEEVDRSEKLYRKVR